MKVLVTGGAGFIGSNLALALQENGHRVTVLDNFSSGDFRNLNGFLGDVIAKDIGESCLEKDVPDVEVIFHQASITDTTLADQRRMIYSNVEGFRHVLQFASERKLPLIYASSAGVYGDGKIPMKEGQTLRPLNAYAFSKCIIDNIAKESMGRAGFVLVGLRYFNVYGPHEAFKAKSASMIYQLAQQMKAGKRPRIFKFGEQQRDHIYVKDVIDANLKAMEAKRSGIVNIGTGIATSFNRLVELLNQALETDLKPDYFDNPYQSAYQDYTQADTRAAEKLLGFQTRFSIEEGTRDYLTLK